MRGIKSIDQLKPENLISLLACCRSLPAACNAPAWKGLEHGVSELIDRLIRHYIFSIYLFLIFFVCVSVEGKRKWEEKTGRSCTAASLGIWVWTWMRCVPFACSSPNPRWHCSEAKVLAWVVACWPVAIITLIKVRCVREHEGMGNGGGRVDPLVSSNQPKILCGMEKH